MIKMPGIKSTCRFLLHTAPLIGITLLGIRLITAVADGSLKPLHATNPGCVRVAPSRSLATLLPVPEGFSPVAKVTSNEEHDVPTGHWSPRYTRREVVITLPKHLSAEEVDANLRAVARGVLENGAMSVSVEARGEGKTPDSSQILAHLTFAPRGEWHRANRMYDPKEYKAVIRRTTPGTTTITTIGLGDASANDDGKFGAASVSVVRVAGEVDGGDR